MKSNLIQSEKFYKWYENHSGYKFEIIDGVLFSCKNICAIYITDLFYISICSNYCLHNNLTRRKIWNFKNLGEAYIYYKYLIDSESYLKYLYRIIIRRIRNGLGWIYRSAAKNRRIF